MFRLWRHASIVPSRVSFAVSCKENLVRLTTIKPQIRFLSQSFTQNISNKDTTQHDSTTSQNQDNNHENNNSDNSIIPPKSVRYWLYGCAAMVFGIVIVGGATRLTNSGLSMVEWKPTSILPPLTNEEWDEEFSKYKSFPEFKKLNQRMTVDEFKMIFFWEYSHRMIGRAIGVVFFFPFVYFLAKKQIPSSLKPKLWAMLAMGGGQGFLGWYMVKSGLDEATLVTSYPTVSPYRLSAHLTSAFTIYSFILWTALSLSYPNPHNYLKQNIQKFRVATLATGTLLAITIVSGAFVAGLDAGLVYNEFPYMGETIIPKEWAQMIPLWKNFTENPVAVQFNHRALATSTAATVLALYLYAQRFPLSPRSKVLMNLVLGMTGVQASLGISTLLLYVPVELGVAHQSGSLVLLSLLILMLHSLRVPKSSIRQVTNVAKQALK